MQNNNCKLFSLSLERWSCALICGFVGAVLLILLALAIVLGCSRRKIKSKYLRLKEESTNKSERLNETASQDKSTDVEATSARTAEEHFEAENCNLIRDKLQEPESHDADTSYCNNAQNSIETSQEIQSRKSQKLASDTNVSSENNSNTDKIVSSAPVEDYGYAEVESTTKKQSQATNQHYEETVLNETNSEPADASEFILPQSKLDSTTPYVLATKNANSQSSYRHASEVESESSQQPSNGLIATDQSYDRLFSSVVRDSSLAYESVVLPNRSTMKLRSQHPNIDVEDLPLPPPPLPPPYVESDNEDDEISEVKAENVYDLPD